MNQTWINATFPMSWRWWEQRGKIKMWNYNFKKINVDFQKTTVRTVFCLSRETLLNMRDYDSIFQRDLAQYARLRQCFQKKSCTICEITTMFLKEILHKMRDYDSIFKRDLAHNMRDDNILRWRSNMPATQQWMLATCDICNEIQWVHVYKGMYSSGSI